MRKPIREHWIKLRVNDEEREKYRWMSAASGMPLSDLIRWRMAEPIIDAPRKKQRSLRTETADPKLMQQLAAIGNNLNQIARAVNSHGLRPDDSAMLLTYLAGVQDELRQLRELPRKTEAAADAP